MALNRYKMDHDTYYEPDDLNFGEDTSDIEKIKTLVGHIDKLSLEIIELSPEVERLSKAAIKAESKASAESRKVRNRKSQILRFRHTIDELLFRLAPDEPISNDWKSTS